MQCAPNWWGERARHAHRIILLQPRYRVRNLRRKYAVNRAAIITPAFQRRLHRTDISRIKNQLVARLEVITPAPAISRRKIGRVHVRRLMSGSPLVPLSQRIDGSKNTIIDNVKLVAPRDRCAQPDNQNECYSFHHYKGLMHVFIRGKIRRR